MKKSEFSHSRARHLCIEPFDEGGTHERNLKHPERAEEIVLAVSFQ